MDDDVIAGFGGGQRQGASDAAAGAGDERPTAVRTGAGGAGQSSRLNSKALSAAVTTITAMMA